MSLGRLWSQGQVPCSTYTKGLVTETDLFGFGLVNFSFDQKHLKGKAPGTSQSKFVGQFAGSLRL